MSALSLKAMPAKPPEIEPVLLVTLTVAASMPNWPPVMIPALAVTLTVVPWIASPFTPLARITP